ncbi:hypothetical protein J4V51_26840, partial [Escherichia coli]
LRFSGPKTSIICSPMTSLKTSIKTITYLSDTGCLEIQGASLQRALPVNELTCYGLRMGLMEYVKNRDRTGRSGNRQGTEHRMQVQGE